MSARSAIQASDPHDEAFARDPFPVWERLRHDAPLFHDTVADVYRLTRYDVTYSTWIYTRRCSAIRADSIRERADLWRGDSRGGVRRDGAASHLAFGLGSQFCVAYKRSRLAARGGIVRLVGDRRPAPTGPVPPLRMHQYHLSVPWLRVTLTQGGSQ